jgi:hypothetical protein
MLRGLQRSLPLTLMVTFLLVPSAATRIFKTFLCDQYELNNNVTRRYLLEDLSLDCDGSEYNSGYLSIWNLTVALMILWPVGVPLLYAILLWATRDALRTGTSTHLSRATAFLWADWTRSAFLWEPMEMCRKLTLSISAGIQTAAFCTCSQLTGVRVPDSRVGPLDW